MRSFILWYGLFLCSLTAVAQADEEGRYSLPRRQLPLQKCLLKLNEAGAKLSYRPDQIPDLALSSPGGWRSLTTWLAFLLQDTELTFAETNAGWVIFPDPALPRRSFTIHGIISDVNSGERLIAAAAQQAETTNGVLSNEYGFYSFVVPGGRRKLVFSYVGYRPQTIDIVLRSDTTLYVKLQPGGALPEVVVTPVTKTVEKTYLEDSRSSIQAKVATRMGGLGGTADPLRVARLLPGVETGTDGLGGIFIRGSEAGHNLVLLDGVPVYSLNHAAGLLSIFNNRAIRKVDLYKDGMPARFGGRIGGVLDVHTRDGNLYRNETIFGASLLTADFVAEGPIRPGESSFLVAGRSFWGRSLLRRFSERAKRNNGRRGRTDYQVYDINFKINQQAGEKGRLYFSLYNGFDDYANTSRTSDRITVLTNGGAVFPYESVVERNEVATWGNTVGAIRYNHIFNDRFFGNFRLSYSGLTVNAAFEKSDSLNELSSREVVNGDIYSGLYNSNIRQFGVAFDGQYRMAHQATLRFGVALDVHRFIPLLRAGAFALSRPQQSVLEASTDSDKLYPFQSAIYGSYKGRWRGVRYRFGLRGQLWASGRKFINISPRLLLTGKLGRKSGWRIAFDQAAQPVHLISSTIIGLPSDLWIPATGAYGPSTSQQTSVQLIHQLGADWNVVVGKYYRDIRNLVNFTEEGRDWQNSLSRGDGFARGIEITASKTRGLFSGWVSYAWAQSRRQFDERINLGRPFDFRYARQHSVKALVNWQPNADFSLTADFRYGTGTAFSISDVTLRLANPATVSEEQDIIVNLTKNRNGFRLPDNHRLDVNAHFFLRGKRERYLHEITLGIYNLYNRHNPILYDIESNYLSVRGNLVNDRRFKQIFIPGFLPTLSYHLKITGNKDPDLSDL